jgi:hypothetical protein
LPSKPQVDTSCALHVLLPALAPGDAPVGRFVHVPGDPAAAHVRHPSVQGELQQTPSAQKPLAHSAPHVHAAPSALEAAGGQLGPVSGCVSGIRSGRSTPSCMPGASGTGPSPPSGLLAFPDLWQLAASRTSTAASIPRRALCRTVHTRVMTFDKASSSR